MMPANDAPRTDAPISPAQPPALSLDAVTKRYDDRPVLDSLFLSVPAGSVLWGTPAQPRREYLRQMAALKRLAKK